MLSELHTDPLKCHRELPAVWYNAESEATNSHSLSTQIPAIWHNAEREAAKTHSISSQIPAVWRNAERETELLGYQIAITWHYA